MVGTSLPPTLPPGAGMQKQCQKAGKVGFGFLWTPCKSEEPSGSNLHLGPREEDFLLFSCLRKERIYLSAATGLNFSPL